MAQVTTGMRAILSSPVIYELLQNAMGAKRAREKIVRNYIRPFPGMRILDLGCGAAEILSFLPDDVDYVGYDISAPYIEAARRRFAGRGAFHLRMLDEVEARTLASFDLVMAIGVLHHLDDEEARALMRVARAALKPTGRLFTHDPCYAPGQNPIARFLISQDRGRNVRDAEGYAALARAEFGAAEGVLSHQAWIPYTHWAMELVQEMRA